MALPRRIELVPLERPVAAQVVVPGSKSLTNRAMILAALSEGVVTLEGALWSEDTQVMAEALSRLGWSVEVEEDPHESANRRIQVTGRGGKVPEGGTRGVPLELFVGNAGTAARFLMAMVCLGRGWYRLHGVPRMHERPQAGLVQALKDLGYRVESMEGDPDCLPLLIEGAGRRPGALCQVSIQESSQFASALLLAARWGGWEVNWQSGRGEHAPYVSMTEALIRDFPASGGVCSIEADASGGSYFWAIGGLQGLRFPSAVERVEVCHWPTSGWQVDACFPRFWPLPETISRESDLGDSIMTSIVMAPWAAHPVRFTDLGRLRVQECERVLALKTELRKCGVRVEEEGDVLTVFPSRPHGARISTYHDHRMAMCFAVLGTVVSGIVMEDPECVKKTFPNFFRKLASSPPLGMGVGVLDAETRQPLCGDLLDA